MFMTTLIDSSLTENFSDDSSKVGICWLCRTTLRLYLTNPPLLCTTKYYKVLQSTTPVLLRTTNELLQYYSVLQSTTPVLQNITPRLLRTTEYYKILLQYYSVLQSTAPLLYYKVLSSTGEVVLVK